MGAAGSIHEAYEYSPSQDDSDSKSMSASIKKWAMRKRSISTAADPLIKLDPVRSNLLSVPCLERHPFQDYRFGKKLGNGSFSVVYKGFSQHLDGGQVALKEIHLKPLSKMQKNDLILEMNILSQLKHESIVELKSVYVSSEKRFLIMEYLKGGQLLNAICKREYYKESDARRIMLQITSALIYMHDRGVIHRDIKPENLILLDRSLESPIKIVDFGFATLESEVPRSFGKHLVGSPGYFAPEVLRDRTYSTKVDIWSLGVVLYIILSGVMPFSIDRDDEEAIINGNYCFFEDRFRSVSNLAKDLISKMLVVDVNRRYSAREVLNHPWMQLPIIDEHSNNQDNSESNEIVVDADLSDNLEYIRQTNANRRFNLAAMVMSTVSIKRKNSSTSNAMNINDKEIRDKISLLSSAIGAHNSTAVMS